MYFINSSLKSVFRNLILMCGSLPVATNSRHNHQGQAHSKSSGHGELQQWSCHSSQHASSPVDISDSGASSTCNRCSVTISSAQQSHSESKDHPGGRGIFNSQTPGSKNRQTPSLICQILVLSDMVQSNLVNPTLLVTAKLVSDCKTVGLTNLTMALNW